MFHIGIAVIEAQMYTTRPREKLIKVAGAYFWVTVVQEGGV